MSKLFAFIGASILGWAGWWLGAHIGIMTAFITSMLGTGVGIYYGKKAADHYLP